MVVVAEMASDAKMDPRMFQSPQRGAWEAIKKIPSQVIDAATRIVHRKTKPPEKPDEELTPELLEWWRKLPARVVPYNPGICRDGKTLFPGGQRLLIGQPGKEQQVMDSFELPWVVATVREMWKNRGAQDVGERGFGLGLMSDEIHKRMVTAQEAQIAKKTDRPIKPQIHVIAELNENVFANAKGWAKEKFEKAVEENRPLRIRLVDANGKEEMQENFPLNVDRNALVEIKIVNGDADEVMLKFPPASFDLMFSDTHQLAPQFLGIHDILRLNQLKSLLRRNGKFTFLAWHRENQTMDIDTKQRRRIGHDFEHYGVSTTTKVTIPNDCEYLEGSELILPVVICTNPRMD